MVKGIVIAGAVSVLYNADGGLVDGDISTMKYPPAQTRSGTKT
jgi:hypothetical protein